MSTLPDAEASRRWLLVAAAIALGVFGVGAIVASSDRDDVASSTEGGPPSNPTVTSGPLLSLADQKDGDSFVASDGVEYRLGMVDTPEPGQPCQREAADFTRGFLAEGFTADAYSSDNYGRTVAEVVDREGRSLNVALARNGLADDRYLQQFRDENPGLADRLDDAFDRADVPGCAGG